MIALLSQATAIDDGNRSVYAVTQRTVLRERFPVTRGSKSLASRALAQRLGAIHLASDAERKRLAGMPEAARLPACAYTASQTEAIYNKLLAHAQTVLESRYTAIVDATFLRERNRAAFIDFANRLGIQIVILDFVADLTTLFARVEARAAVGRDASDADPAVLVEQLARAEPLSTTERALAICFETGIEPTAYESEVFWRPLLEALAP